MKRISKVFVVLVLMLLMVSMMTTVVKAGTADLISYINNYHVLNSMIWEISNEDKAKITNYISTLSDATADSIISDLQAAENVVILSGVTNHNDLTAAQQAQIVSYAQSAASKAGGSLTVNLSARTYSLTFAGSTTTVLSGRIDDVIVDPGTAGGGSSSTSSTTSSGKTLLYTGANYVAYALVTVAIVAVAVVVKKRS